ncbi:uncharacterized protein PV06_10979 [Exophiala oligosperma]|uniref:RING-type domain-containing protein n=2 Tax=Chaetothyriales TaxID=34395 RepID=A0A0D2DMB0_9EURO|nr:uncharacterized protein PV06_10979 [Exophiala oligosperma]KAJ9613768.1 hypothetical protein H2204_014655 [Knufia peltigerae]KIW36864.1 hypothetical protein PV06_10979 [Exophiala oligosperma]
MSTPPTPFGDLLSFPSGHQVDHNPHRFLPPPQRPSQPPLLPPPRLFRNFFGGMPDSEPRRQAILPRADYQDTVHDVSRALQSANRALQRAQDAFEQSRRPGPGEPERSAGDFTEGNSQSNSPESHFISQTTHPHDLNSTQRPRGLNTLDQPVYGHPISSLPDANETLPVLTIFPASMPPFPRLPHLRTDHNRLQAIVDREAINRQRENHSHWERTQARNRERAQNQPRQSPSEMSPPSSSSSSSARRNRRQAPSPSTDPTIESVDLTEIDDSAALSATLAKQRQEAILSQNPGTEAGRTPLTAYKCPVCMETPTDPTATICGHVFCHRCIIDTLTWSIQQRREDIPPSRRVKGVCPVCRKPLDIKDLPGLTRTLVPLELKLLVKKRKREDKGKQKLVKAETISSDDDDEGEEKTAEKENRRSGKKRRAPAEEEEDEDEALMWAEFMAAD